MKKRVLLLSITLIIAGVIIAYFVPFKSRYVSCSDDRRFSLLLGQGDAYERFSAPPLGINMGACTPSNAKASLYLF